MENAIKLQQVIQNIKEKVYNVSEEMEFNKLQYLCNQC